MGGRVSLWMKHPSIHIISCIYSSKIVLYLVIYKLYLALKRALIFIVRRLAFDYCTLQLTRFYTYLVIGGYQHVFIDN